MNAQKSLTPIIGIAAALMSLFVIASVLLGHGNQLAQLFRYLLVAGFLSGIMFPRGTLFFWLALCGYTDLLKRLMVVFGRVQYSDLYNVLGIPPMMLGGVTVAVLIGAFTGRFNTRAAHWRLFIIACVLMLVSAVLAAKEKGGSLGAILPAIANDGSYTMLLFVLPVLFADTDDIVRLVKVLLWSYVPVALYGLFQQLNGFQDFEIAYLKSGLTLEIKQLYASEVRAFSTLNSPTSFSVVCAIMCVLGLVLAYTPKKDGSGPLLNKGLAFAFAAIYFVGIIASTSRSALLLVVIGWGGFLCFRSVTATRWLYAVFAAAFLGLIFMADVILDNLDSWQSQISNMIGGGGGQLATQLSRVGTFSDRLHGFANLAKNPEVYTLFGYGPDRGSDERDPLYAHDMISNILVTHGLVPLVAMGIFGIVVLTRMHGRVFRLADRHHRLLAAGFLSLAFSLFALSAVSGSVISVFPVNTLLWLCFALLMLVYQGDHLQMEARVEGVRPEALPVASPPPRVVHRFRRSAGHL